MSSAPNFFVVGAPKTGTTSLYHYLDQHPAVFMSPIKEPCFFAPEVITYTARSRELFEADRAALRVYINGPKREKRDRGIVLEWEQYLKLFENVRGQTAVGEGSVSYLGSTGAPGRIRSRIPHARIIMMLRDPVDRLFAQYAPIHATGEVKVTFAQWAVEQASLEASRPVPFGPVWTGRYVLHLQRYLERFPRNRIRVYLYDDFVREPATLIRDMLGFVGVDPTVPIDTRHRHNVTLVRRWPALYGGASQPFRRALRAIVPDQIAARIRALSRTPPPFRQTASDRARVIELYQEDIRALAALIGRDLSAWMKDRT